MPYNLKLVPTLAKKLRHLPFDLNCILLTTHTIRHQSWHTHTYTHLRCRMRLSGARWTDGQTKLVSSSQGKSRHHARGEREREARCLSWDRGHKPPGASRITKKTLYKQSGTGKDLLEGHSANLTGKKSRKKELQQR